MLDNLDALRAVPPLDAKYAIDLRTPLSESQYQQLISIPGVEPGHAQRTRILVPANAGFIVQRELSTLKLDVKRVRKLWDPKQLKGIWLPDDQPIASAIPTFAGRPSDGPLGEVRGWVFPWLREYQRDCIDFAILRGGGLVWAPPGSGKTVCAVAFFSAAPGAVLIATHSRELIRRQWCAAVDRFTGIKAFNVRSPSQERAKDGTLQEYVASCAARGSRPVAVVGWATLREHWAKIVEILKPVSFIADEIQMAKQNSRVDWNVTIDEETMRPDFSKKEAVISVSTAAYETAARCSRRLGTTGTFIHNQWGTDVWGQLSCIEPGSWGKTAKRLQVRYTGGHLGDYGWIEHDDNWIDPESTAEFRARLAFSTIRIPYGVYAAELPPKRRELVRVPVEEQVAALPGLRVEIKKEATAERNALASGKKHDSSRLRELRLQEDASKARNAIKDRIALHATAGKGKVLVFTGRIADVEALAAAARTATRQASEKDAEGKRRSDVFLCHGSLSIEEREAAINGYAAAPGPAVLIATWQSCGTAQDGLQDTDVMIWAHLPDTPGDLDQGEGRIHRLGMDVTQDAAGVWLRPILYEYILVEEGYSEEHFERILLPKLTGVEKMSDGSSLEGVSETIRGVADREAILAKAIAKLEASEW